MPAPKSRFPQKNKKTDYRVNRQIRISEVFLIDDKGEQIGEVSIQDAQRRAQEAILYLVEVAPNARAFARERGADRAPDQAPVRRSDARGRAF